MPTERKLFSGPYKGILTDVPPTLDDQGFEDIINFVNRQRRMWTRPGLKDSGIAFPSGELPLNMFSFLDIQGFFHTVLLTNLNAYMLQSGAFHLLTLPVYISKATLNAAGSGYSLYDTLNLLQVGAFGGTVLVTGILSNPITGVSIQSGGNGYMVGDILTPIQGPASGATIHVDAVVGGVITAISIITPGQLYFVAGSVSVSGGSGSGATINITSVGPSGVITQAVLDNPGSNYIPASGVPTTGGTGTGATFDLQTTSIASLGGLTGTNLPYAVVKANNQAYFCNGSIPVCYIDGEAQFKVAGNVPGSCRYLTTDGDHLIGASWNEPAPNVNGSISFPLRVRWTDVGNYLEWSNANPASTAGFADITDVPDIISGLSTLGVMVNVYRTNGISQLNITGNSSNPFTNRNFSTSPKGEGLAYPYSLTTYNNIDRFIGNYDVWAFDGTNFIPLMDKRCNARFFSDLQSVTGIVRGFITPVLANGFTFLGYIITLPGANVSWVLNISDGTWSRFMWAPPTEGMSGFSDLQFLEQVVTS